MFTGSSLLQARTAANGDPVEPHIQFQIRQFTSQTWGGRKTTMQESTEIKTIEVDTFRLYLDLFTCDLMAGTRGDTCPADLVEETVKDAPRPPRE